MLPTARQARRAHHRVDACAGRVDGPIVLSGKVDLTIGRPAGAESRKVIIDLKTGWAAPKHREDLRFYALVETLRTQVPPRKLASFYLDAGQPVVEDVTEATLLTRVTPDARRRQRRDRAPRRRPPPGQATRHQLQVVPARRRIAPEGTAHLAGRVDPDAELDPDT